MVFMDSATPWTSRFACRNRYRILGLSVVMIVMYHMSVLRIYQVLDVLAENQSRHLDD